MEYKKPKRKSYLNERSLVKVGFARAVIRLMRITARLTGRLTGILGNDLKTRA